MGGYIILCNEEFDPKRMDFLKILEYMIKFEIFLVRVLKEIYIGSVLFTIYGNLILSYSPKFSKNHSFLYSNQNPIISYSVGPNTFYILHTYFLSPFTSYTPILYHLLHLTHLYPTTFYQKF